MSKRHTTLMAAIGMAGAIAPTYRDQTMAIPSARVDKLLNAIEQQCQIAIHSFGRIGRENILNLEKRIDSAHADRDILGRARSIITFIDYAIWLLENTMTGDKPAANIKGKCGRIHIQRIIDALVDLRFEIAGDRRYEVCSIAGIKAAERWMQL